MTVGSIVGSNIFYLSKLLMPVLQQWPYFANIFAIFLFCPINHSRRSTINFWQVKSIATKLLWAERHLFSMQQNKCCFEEEKLLCFFLGAALLFFSCPYLIPVLCLAPIKKGKKCIMECQAREKFYRDQKNLIANSKNFLVERSMGLAPSKPVLQLAAMVWPLTKNWKTFSQYIFYKDGLSKGLWWNRFKKSHKQI